jgi:O-antigen/teichoic acid export membrane protein
MSIIKKVLASFKNVHFQSLIGSGIMALLNMLIVAILYHTLSVIDIGVYVFLMTFIALIDTIKGGFLNIPFVTFYAGTDEARANDVSGSSWCLALLVSGALIIVNILTWFVSFYVTNEGMVLFLKYFALISVSTLPTFMATLVVQAEKRFDRLLWLRLINQVLFTATVIVLIYLKKADLTLILIAYTVCNIIASFASIFIGWTKIESIRYATKKTFWELFHFGKYSAATNMSSNLFRVTDTFFINFFLGPAALAMYNLGGRLIQLVEIPLQSFVASGMPNLSSFYNKGQNDSMMYVMRKMVGMLTLAILIFAIFSVVFATPIITLIGGSKYSHSVAPNLFRLFIIVAVLYPTDRFFALTLDIIHKPEINFYKILVALGVNFICDAIGVTFFKSIYEIALPNIFPVAVAIIMGYIPLNKYYKFNFWSTYVIGYNESVLFIKQLWSSLPFGKKVNQFNKVGKN